MTLPEVSGFYHVFVAFSSRN